MDVALIVALVVGVIALLSLIVAYSQYRENHGDHVSAKRVNVIKQVVAELPLTKTVADNTSRLSRVEDRDLRVEEMLKDNTSQMRVFADTLARMGVKVDMYWTSLESLAMNSAKNLHQPDPKRAHIDRLLEAFMEGTLTADERIELRKVLVQIRNYEPNGTTPLDFPVHPGEQTAAAILLSTMDIVDPSKMAALGHAEHRNHATLPLDPGA